MFSDGVRFAPGAAANAVQLEQREQATNLGIRLIENLLMCEFVHVIDQLRVREASFK